MGNTGSFSDAKSATNEKQDLREGDVASDCETGRPIRAVTHKDVLAATTYPAIHALDPTECPLETCDYRCDGIVCDFSQCRATVDKSVVLKRSGVRALVGDVVADVSAHQAEHMAHLFDGFDVNASFGVALRMHRSSERRACGRIAAIDLSALADD